MAQQLRAIAWSSSGPEFSSQHSILGSSKLPVTPDGLRAHTHTPLKIVSFYTFKVIRVRCTALEISNETSVASQETLPSHQQVSTTHKQPLASGARLGAQQGQVWEEAEQSPLMKNWRGGGKDPPRCPSHPVCTKDVDQPSLFWLFLPEISQRRWPLNLVS